MTSPGEGAPSSRGVPDDADDDFRPPPRGMGAPNPKLQRWVDLVAALLARTQPATFDEIAPHVAEYARVVANSEKEHDPASRKRIIESLKRSFERDKDELRDFGVPIESLEDANGNLGAAYRLKRNDFYLPYLCFAVPGGAVVRPQGPDTWGYRALTSLTFEADELQAVVDAAAGVRALGDPILAADVDHALRKLAVDLPVESAMHASDEPRVVLSRARPDAATFEALGDALRRRKVVSFTYHSMSSDRTEMREVEPYGLFFISAHWYLAGRDRARQELRNFRLSRMSAVKVNTARAQSEDYEIDAAFRLREHARSRQAWELGDGEPATALVSFVGASGPTVAASRLGRAVEGRDDLRAFEVRRPDAFVRWLLSFAGEVVPREPGSIVQAYRDVLVTTTALYAGQATRDSAGNVARAPSASAPAMSAAATTPAGDAPRGDRDATPTAGRAAPSGTSSPAASSAGTWQPKGAAAQLKRILHVVPQIADGEEHSLQAVAERVGTTVETLQRDLYSLVARFDAPGGFVEGVQLFVEPDRVSALSNHLLRPMRLTVPELCALELGLAVLRAMRPPDEHAVLDRASERLRDVIARLPGDPIPDAVRGASLGAIGTTEHLVAVRTALRERRKLRLVYRKSGSATAGERIVSPYALVVSSGMLYVAAHCDREAGIRVFRMDRVEAAEATDDRYERPADFSLDTVVREGRVFQHEAPGTMRVRYSPRVARWIAEREGLAVAADGSLEVEHPLADPEWGVRHVLQYGGDAEVLAPAGMRKRMRERLTEMNRASGVATA